MEAGPRFCPITLPSNIPTVTLSWRAIDISGNRPSRRSHHTTVVNGNKLILFGGLGAAASQDLWELNTMTMKWNKIELSKNPTKIHIADNLVGPSARYGHRFPNFIYGLIPSPALVSFWEQRWFFLEELETVIYTEMICGIYISVSYIFDVPS